MRPLRLTQGALAAAMGVERRLVNELCNDKRAVTVDTALMLGRVFGQYAGILAERAAAQRSVGGVEHAGAPQADRARAAYYAAPPNRTPPCRRLLRRRDLAHALGLGGRRVLEVQDAARVAVEDLLLVLGRQADLARRTSSAAAGSQHG